MCNDDESPGLLGGWLEYCHELLGRVNRLKSENLRLRAALEFYANPHNWKDDDWGVASIIATPDYGKPGKTARDALGRSNNEIVCQDAIIQEEE